MKCTVCNHSRCRDIDLALLAGKTLDALKQQFGLSRSALHRHKNHLLEKVDRAEALTAKNLRFGYLFQLNDYNKAAAATVAAARAEGNSRLTLQAANSGARIITAMARFEVELDRETTYRLLTAPEYVQPDCLLPGDPHILAGPRQTLARSLASDCPETAAADLYDLEDLADYLKIALEPEGDICPPAARQLEFPDFLIPLSDILPPSGPRSPETGKQPKPKRDKSGTKTGQTRLRPKNSQQDQIDILNKKRSATNAAKACPNGLHQTNSALPHESSLSPKTENDLLADPCPLKTDDLADMFITGNRRPASFPLAAAPGPDSPAPPVSEELPGLCNRSGDELFLMTHGYPRNNPPKHIPNRHRDEDTLGFSMFREIKKYF